MIIDAPHFYAAVIFDAYGRVERAAPILNYMRGWDRQRVISYAGRKGWKTIELAG